MDNVIIFCAKYLFVFVVLGLIWAWLVEKRSRKVEFIIVTIIAGLVALALSRVAGQLFYDTRPFVAQHIKPLIAHAADNGFPSDHALFTMTLTAIVYFYNKKIAAGMLALTFAVGLARVLAHIHSWLDIGGGWVLGIVGAFVGYYGVRWFLSRRARAD